MTTATLVLSLTMSVMFSADKSSSTPPVNIASNAGFEIISNLNTVDSWSFESWKNTTLASMENIDKKTAHSGRQSLCLSNMEADDARFVQILTVKPNTWYRFTVWIRTENVGQNEIGANMSVLNVTELSPDIRGTKEWTRIEVCGKTAKKQTELPLALRLGFYGNPNAGQAWFDDLTVEEIKNVPTGATLMRLFPDPTPPTTQRLPGFAGIPQSVLLVWGLAICLGYVFLSVFLLRRKKQLRSILRTQPSQIFFILIGSALLTKTVLALCMPGYPADTGTFSSWALEAYRLGPAGFYRPEYFADYPPGYIYILYLIGALSHILNANSGTPTFLLLLKLPAIAADLCGVLILYRMGTIGLESPRSAKNGIFPNNLSWIWIAPILWLLSPLATFNSSVWGQVDSIFSLTLLVAFWKLESGKRITAAALFAVAVLLKPQALLVAPLALIYLATLRPFNIRSLLGPIISFLITATILTIPFAIRQHPLWIFSLYGTTLGSYDFATLNAANLWYLAGLNWAPTATLCLGLPVYLWGWILSIPALTFVCFCLFKNKSRGGWLLSAYATYVLFFCLAARMHERYLFPAALLGLGAFQISRDRRLLWAAVAASLICFLDIFVTMHTVLATGSSMAPPGSPLMIISSVGMLGLLIYTLYLCFDVMVRGHHDELSIQETDTADDSEDISAPADKTQEEPFLIPSMPGKHGRRAAALALAGLTLGYSLLSLLDLGSHSSPNNYWEPKNPGATATFDLSKITGLAGIQFHNGLGSGEYALEYSTDGTTWNTGIPIINDNPYAEMRWRTVQDPRSARYIRITMIRGNLQLNELSLNPASGPNLPQPTLLMLSSNTADSVKAAILFDEPGTRVTVSDYSNGMYFDEIFFAKSALEILQGRNASENTHPPLGKIIIAGSIALLGMNPFAYRLPGAIAGILMIPVMYLLALRLFRRRRWALLAAFFLATDFMHYTQTRIATVDTFVLLFVLCSYYWMIVWRQEVKERISTDNRNPKPLLYLLLSGIAIGLSIATKWTGLYAATGLAVLFFTVFFRMGMDWLKANAGKTILVCILSFVVIPSTIYACSYIPLMESTGLGFTGMLENQTSMWRYHSQMKDTHPFSSPWYLWPLMTKPVWYYAGATMVAANLTSTIQAFGNPVVWMGGSAAFILLILCLLLRTPQTLRRIRPTTYNRQIMSIICIAGLAQYLPWAIIPRKLVFIYHFFLTVPFLILALVFVLRTIAGFNSKSKSITLITRNTWLIVGIIAGLFFIIYFPVLGGRPFPRWWAESLRVFGIPVYY